MHWPRSAKKCYRGNIFLPTRVTKAAAAAFFIVGEGRFSRFFCVAVRAGPMHYEVSKNPSACCVRAFVLLLFPA